MQQKSIKEALGRLADLPHFFVWRLFDKDETGKYKKVPWRGHKFDHLAARREGTLSSYEAAATELAWYTAQATGGDMFALGYSIDFSDGVWFLDIDLKADPKDSPEAYQALPGVFFEYSSSGTGVHFIGTWENQIGHHSTPGIGVELYSGARGICFGFSGVAWGSADTVVQPPAKWLKAPLADKVALPSGRMPEWNGPEDDAELIEKMLSRREATKLITGGPTLRQLWEGYGIAEGIAVSEYDNAVATQLAWWTGCDQARMVRLMMRSGRVRDKWLERDDYLPRTVRAACEFHMANSPGKCLGARPALPPLPAPVVAVSPVVQLPEGMGIEARAVAQEHGVQDTLEHRGLAGAKLVIRNAGNMEELKEAAGRVVAMGYWDSVDTDLLALEIQRKSTELASRLGIALCRTMLSPAGVASSSGAAPAIGAPDWLAEWCFVKAEGKFCHMPRGYLRVSKESFDLVNATADGVPRKANGLAGKPSELWPDWGGTNVDALGFDPREGQFYNRGNTVFCNEFVGTMPEHDYTPPNADAVEFYKRHLLCVCNGDVDAYQIVLQWMARIVQQPGIPARWAIFMIGEEGTGKTKMIDPLVRAIGRPNVRVSGSKSVNNGGGFMDWAAHGKMLGIINDFVITGPGMYETAEAIKPVITDDIVTITRKGSPDFTYENFASYLATGNNKSPMPISAGSRRWYFVRTTVMDAFALTPAAHEYFKALLWAVDALTPGQWRVFFESVPLPAEFPIRAPWSAELENVLANNLSESNRAVAELIGTHKIIPGNQITAALRGIEGAPSTRGIGKMMQELGFNAFAKRVKIGSAPCTVYVHSSLGNGVNEAFVAEAARQFSLLKDKERFATSATPSATVSATS